MSGMQRAYSVAAGLLFSLLFAAPASAEFLWGLTTDGTLVRFSNTTPGTIERTLTVTGLPPGARLLAIEVYTWQGTFAGLASDGQVYAIDRNTGEATLTRTLTPPVPTGASAYGMAEYSYGVFVHSDTGQRTRLPTFAGYQRRRRPSGRRFQPATWWR